MLMVIFVIFVIILFVKNEKNYSVRIKFLEENREYYNLLPDYNYMVFCLHLWTYAQWAKYVEDRLKK